MLRGAKTGLFTLLVIRRARRAFRRLVIATFGWNVSRFLVISLLNHFGCVDVFMRIFTNNFGSNFRTLEKIT